MRVLGCHDFETSSEGIRNFERPLGEAQEAQNLKRVSVPVVIIGSVGCSQFPRVCTLQFQTVLSPVAT